MFLFYNFSINVTIGIWICLAFFFYVFVHLVFSYRREAYTCWPQNSGAEEFNFGSRIDHILCAGSCLHQEQDQQDHSFVACHVKECDILTQYKRWKPGNTLRYGIGFSHSSSSDNVSVACTTSTCWWSMSIWLQGCHFDLFQCCQVERRTTHQARRFWSCSCLC